MAQLDYGTAGYQGLSYSRLGTFHQCGRKYQIENAFGLKQRNDSVTFSYGHAVAAGVQAWFETGNMQTAVIECAKFYTMPWDDLGSTSEMRAKKNVWYAIKAVEEFVTQMDHGLIGGLANLKDWEIAYLAGEGESTKAAVELQFRILLDGGFVYEGHIDLIIRNKITGEYAILELKTTSMSEPHPSMYGNSSQALSYSIVLDHAVGYANTSYKVFYLVYSSGRQKWHMFDFAKASKQRLNWINNLQRDCELIQYYEDAAEQGIPYPENGANCYSFFRPCEYYQVCDMEDDNIKSIYGSGTADAAESFDYTDNTDFVFTIDQIINSQVAKVEQQTGLEVDLGEQHGTIINV